MGIIFIILEFKFVKMGFYLLFKNKKEISFDI